MPTASSAAAGGLQSACSSSILPKKGLSKKGRPNKLVFAPTETNYDETDWVQVRKQDARRTRRYARIVRAVSVHAWQKW
jgi:hypothetical protein